MCLYTQLMIQSYGKIDVDMYKDTYKDEPLRPHGGSCVLVSVTVVSVVVKVVDVVDVVEE